MKNNQDYWYGILYCNPNDSRVIVPKRFRGLGWTLNFGNPYSYIVIAIFVAIIVASQYLS